MIVASALAAKAASWSDIWSKLGYNTHGCYTAAAIFCVGAMAAWGFDAFIHFKKWRDVRYHHSDAMPEKEEPTSGGLA